MWGAGVVPRTLELTTRMNPVQRSQGDSATAKAAYRACCKIDCNREGRMHDYRRKQGLEVAEIALPSHAPAWAEDRASLWNAAEDRERNTGGRGANKNAYRANAQTARDYLFTFPDELSKAGRQAVARAIAAHLVKTHGVAVDYAIHQPGKEGDERNYHCHMMFTTRRLTAEGLTEKTREWDERSRDGKEPSLAKQLRALVARTINVELVREGKEAAVFVEHRTFKERGSRQTPQQHQGPGKSAMERKERTQARRAWFQKLQRDQVERQAKELAGLKLRQDFGMQGKLADIDRRSTEGVAAIRRELARQRAEDRAPDGVRRVFVAVTGKAGREAFDRQARDAQRVADADGKLAALKQELKAERNAYSTAQSQERKSVIERHAGEDRQLQEALRSRESLDRSAEVVQRREQVRNRVQERDRTQEQGRGRPPAPGPTLN